MPPAKPLFTILLAIVRPPVCLPFAIESVLLQTVDSFELFVICDGAPAETVACAEEFARRDERVRVFPFPKGDRVGEVHRHTALQEARGRYVAHIEDDDLWFPNHLEEMEKLLERVDFGHLIHSYVRPSDGRIVSILSDIGSAPYRQKFLDERYNRFGYTFTGYRLDAYRRLPEGWAPSPPDFWPDLWMWRKFLRMPDFRFGTRAVITAISITAHIRDHDVTEQRSAESRDWWERIQDPTRRAEIIQAAWQFMIEDGVSLIILADGMNAALTDVRAQLESRLAEGAQIAAKLGTTQAQFDETRAELERARARLAGAEAQLANLAEIRELISGLHEALAVREDRLLAVERQAGDVEGLRLQAEKAAADLEAIKSGVETWLLPRMAQYSAALGRRRWLRRKAG